MKTKTPLFPGRGLRALKARPRVPGDSAFSVRPRRTKDENGPTILQHRNLTDSSEAQDFGFQPSVDGPQSVVHPMLHMMCNERTG